MIWLIELRTGIRYYFLFWLFTYRDNQRRRIRYLLPALSKKAGNMGGMQHTDDKAGVRVSKPH